MSDLGDLALVALLAVLVEMIVEYFFKPLLPQPGADDSGELPPWWQTIPYARFGAAAVGVALCLVYQVDVLAMMLPALRPSYVGMLLTGLLISRGSNYLHDWLANPTGAP